MKFLISLLAALPLAYAQWGDHGNEEGGAHHPEEYGQYGPPNHGPPNYGPHSYPYPSVTQASSYASASATATVTSSGASSSATSTQSCTSLTSSEITASGNNSLFTRWRSHSHFIAPAGWSNDPCGAMYDPTQDIYHLFYQWHPEHINWGNISWGYATSKDLITWTDYKGWQGTEAKALGTNGVGNYSGLGVFSGTAQPVNLKGEVDGTLLLMYTSVSYLPTSWNIPYHPYTETQSLAYSTDGGKTFQNYAGNPVISATTNTAPAYWNLTGFRDPFLEASPALDAILGVSEPHYYAVFGSGIKGVGPRIPLWTAPAKDLTSWSFLGALWEPADNTSLGSVLTTGTYGFNFEVSGFFSLPDSDGSLHWFVNMGSEGGNVPIHESSHWALWNEGNVTARANGSALFTPVSGGAGDWGLAYALTSFNDTKYDRRVQWAWAPEDLVGADGLFSASQQGFQGSLALPRELFVHEVNDVANTATLISSKESVLKQNANGTLTAQTLGVRPLADVVAGIRKGATYQKLDGATFTSSAIVVPQGDAHFEVKATVTASTGAYGLTIAASPDGVEYTNIIYNPSDNTVLVVRDHSSTIVEFANSTVTGYFYPYTVGGKTEAVTWDVFVDGSIVEVYINDRFALTTRVYPSKECSTGFGVYVGSGGSVTFSGVEAWLGTLNVWPERPLNSSSQLVWDTPEQTNNYTWWSGN